MNSDYITIEDCEFHETGDVAISANAGGTYEGLKLLRNHIHHTNGTGEGMYLGCNSNGCRIANSLIEGNYIHHTNRATVEQGDSIEIKEGSYGNAGADGLSGGSSGYVDGNGISIDMVAGNYNGAPPIDPFPAPGSALVGAGDPAHITAVDFDGNPRSGSADVGAYAFDQDGNPGWTITTGFKTITSGPTVPMPPEDLRAD